MIIPDSFLEKYNDAVEKWEPVKEEVDGLFLHEISKNFPGSTYSSRIKTAESLFLKAQKENYQFPFREIDDFFACQMVVNTLPEIKKTKQYLTYFFDVVEQDSKKADPTAFSYEDLHFFLKLKDSELRPNKSVLGLRFEFQVRTFLQSAWQKAGHDVIYKSKIISYGYERIFYQIRALLELADNLISQIEQAAKIINENDENTKEGVYKKDIKRIINLLESNFSPDQLPEDLRRASLVVKSHTELAGITVDDLNVLLDNAKRESNPIMEFIILSPVDKIFVLIFQNHKVRMLEKLNNRDNRHRVLITDEMDDLIPVLRDINEYGRMKVDL